MGKTFAFAPEVFTIPGAAHYLGVSERTVESYIEHDLIHTFRLPAVEGNGEYLKRTLIRKSELDRLVATGMTI